MPAPERFGFSEFTTWPWPFAKDVAEYPKHGADAIEICEFKLAHNDYRQLLELRDSGLTPASVQMKVHSVFVDSMANKPQDPDDRVAAMKDAIAHSAPYLPPETAFVVITGVPPDGNFRKTADRTVEALRELGAHAAAHGMRIAFEPLNPVNIHTDTSVWYLDQGIDLVERVGHPAVGICIDTWNVWQTPHLRETIQRCGDRIFLVQLSDWKTPRSTADRYSLGDGEIPLRDVVRWIRDTGYQGAWIVEILSSYHLPGSLWKSDLDDVLERNYRAFTALFDETGTTTK
ncbi:MAG TPA: sugar phosphate isomerase/epimerase family protein [Candidatus Acidoferrales bacterium]|nr:sugar phosphate isomerase/epimerase family protein [Candidatus Acidoferrales bacterium]